MKKLIYMFIVPAFLFSCGGSEATDTDDTDRDSTTTEIVEEVEEETNPKPLKSPRKQTSGLIEGIEVSVDYGSPSVRGREIWGDLVPFDKIWRAGANEATSISFSEDVLVNENAVSAGTYALFMIPQEKGEWTIILNEEWSKEEHGVWGAYDHNPEKDVLRFDVSPITFINTNVIEALEYEVQETGILFQWEMIALSIDVKKAN